MKRSPPPRALVLGATSFFHSGAPTPKQPFRFGLAPPSLKVWRDRNDYLRGLQAALARAHAGAPVVWSGALLCDVSSTLRHKSC